MYKLWFDIIQKQQLLYIKRWFVVLVIVSIRITQKQNNSSYKTKRIDTF